MEQPVVAIKSYSKRKLKVFLWILLPIFIIAAIIVLITSENGPSVPGLILLVVGLIDFIFIYVLSEKYYNWPIVFFLIFFIGLFFKRMHWPAANVIAAMGVIFICFISLINSIRFQITLRQNSFLKWFGSISGIIIASYLIGWLFMLQSWSREIGDIFAYTGSILFIISVMGMVFTLPISNYIGWKDNERKIFFRAVLIPMIIVFFLIIITFVINDAYRKILGFDNPPWIL
jgi:hypothetical protein